MARAPIYLEVKDSAGNVVPSASVNIKDRVTGSNAPLFLAETGVTTMSNPGTADSLGRFVTWVDRGVYNAFVTGTGISAYTVPLDTTSDQTLSVPGVPLQVDEVGQPGQVKAGRDFTVADLSSVVGTTQPAGLFNLGSLTNLGYGASLVNKGTVGFASGIGGVANTAAQFTGAVGQAFYILDTGVADFFRMKQGSFGCWMRTAKRGQLQTLMAKGSSVSLTSWYLGINNSNFNSARFEVSTDGTNTTGPFQRIDGTTDICDDKWHFVVGVYDGARAILYVDGQVENSVPVTGGALFSSSAPFNIGNYAADATTNGTAANWGRVDEAFVTTDVLNDDQVRLMMAAKVPHGYGRQPTRAYLGVRRGRRSPTLATTDFPANPAHLYNFSGGSLADSGSLNNSLSSAPLTGSIWVVDRDAVINSAYAFAGAHGGLTTTDAGLPSGTAARTLGAWVKCGQLAAAGTIMGYGLTGQAAGLYISTVGNPSMSDQAAGLGAPVNYAIDDGRWHHVVGVWDPSPADGLYRRLYIDGELLASSSSLNPGSVTLNGTNSFRIGANASTGNQPLVGQIDLPFIYAGALTGDQVQTIFSKPGTPWDASPRDPSEFIEYMDSANVYTICDTLSSVDYIDLSVSS